MPQLIYPLVTSLFIALLPPDAVYLSQSNPDLTCIWGGPGSATLAPYFGTHSDYSIFLCMYSGSSTSLAAGQTIPTTIDIAYSGPDQDFSAYFLGNFTEADGDYAEIVHAFSMGVNNNTTDVYDYLLMSSINNFLQISYVKPIVDVEDGDSSSGGSSSRSGLLSGTGSPVIILTALMIIILSTLLLTYKYRRNPQPKK